MGHRAHPGVTPKTGCADTVFVESNLCGIFGKKTTPKKTHAVKKAMETKKAIQTDVLEGIWKARLRVFHDVVSYFVVGNMTILTDSEEKTWVVLKTAFQT